MIRRRTRGGVLTLHDVSTQPECGACGGEKTQPGEPPIGLAVELAEGAHDGRGLTTSVCADCLSEALAILWGRRHVEGGGDVADLVVPEPGQLGVCPSCASAKGVKNIHADRFGCLDCGARWRGARLGTPR